MYKVIRSLHSFQQQCIVHLLNLGHKFTLFQVIFKLLSVIIQAKLNSNGQVNVCIYINCSCDTDYFIFVGGKQLERIRVQRLHLGSDHFKVQALMNPRWSIYGILKAFRQNSAKVGFHRLQMTIKISALMTW